MLSAQTSAYQWLGNLDGRPRGVIYKVCLSSDPPATEYFPVYNFDTTYVIKKIGGFYSRHRKHVWLASYYNAAMPQRTGENNNNTKQNKTKHFFYS